MFQEELPVDRPELPVQVPTRRLGVHPSPKVSPAGAVSELSEPGDPTVDAPILCVMTRFRLRRPFDLLSTYLDYRRVVKQAHAVSIPGFLMSAFLVEDLTTCLSVSFWSDRRAIAVFGSEVPVHLRAARNVLNHIDMGQDGRPELWSTKWQLVSVSNNLKWNGWDLRSRIGAMARRAEAS